MNPNCELISIWVGGKLAFPPSTSAPSPNADLPDSIRQDYLEAASIVAKSPRGAAALLRLCIQKLCVHLEKDVKDLNNAIAELVEEGLAPRVATMLDIVRVTGNEAVHPGTMNLNDDEATVSRLFLLVNLIADELLTRPRELEAAWQSIPPEKREAIANRKPRKSKIMKEDDGGG